MGLLHPGLMQTMILTMLMNPCGNVGPIREQPQSLHRAIGRHGNICHDRRCLAVVAVLFFAAVLFFPVVAIAAQPMTCLEAVPSLANPYGVAMLCVAGPTAPTNSEHSPGAEGRCTLGFRNHTVLEVAVLHTGQIQSRRELPFLEAGLIQRRRELAFLQAGLIQPTVQEASRTFCKKRKRQVYGARNATADIAGNATYDSDV